MASNPRTKGRMINKSISDSRGFASLTPESAVLFCMILPHLNSYGKLNGGHGYIKDEVCPRISYLTEKNIKKCLAEINAKTNIKWFEHEGRFWVHSTSFLEKHQQLSTDKLGKDLLPSYSGVTLELLPHEVEVEGKEEVEKEGKDFSSSADDACGPFDDFWKAYPRKVGKGDAEKAWKKIKEPATTLKAIIASLEWQKSGDQWTKNNGEYIPHPATYLNQRRWEDEPPVVHSLDDAFPAGPDPRTLPGHCKKCGGGTKKMIDYWECKKCGHKTKERPE
jgi:hypothetical protein